jgi:hypothetical protein
MGSRILLTIFLIVTVQVFSQQRIILFVNGYLGYKHDQKPTDNSVSTKRKSYWYNYDDSIIARFQPVLPVYASGHHSLSTSTHRNLARVVGSYVFSRCFPFRSKKGVFLNTRTNPEGFLTRYESGRVCGQNYLRFVKDSLSQSSQKDTLDIVCHSMGYAYALGILSVIDSSVVLGKILMISPEMAGYRGYDWNKFSEVWQYGSNLGESKADLICFQDGIAPQCRVNGLELLDPSKGGRVYVPKHAKRGFNRSHHLNFFQWFFDLKKGDRGYFGR